MLSSIGIQTSQHNSILDLAKGSISQLADDVNSEKKNSTSLTLPFRKMRGTMGGCAVHYQYIRSGADCQVYGEKIKIVFHLQLK